MRILAVCLLVCALQLQGTASNVSEKRNGLEQLALEKDYELFMMQHVVRGMAVNDCTSEMKKRNIDKKETHTFIDADEKDILAICEDQGQYCDRDHLTRSERKFKTVVCKCVNKGNKGACRYTGQQRESIIVVSCKTLPVHYEKDITDL